MCKWHNCDKPTGSNAKKFCGAPSKTGSCAYKNKLRLNKKYQKDEFKTEYNRCDGTVNNKKERDRDIKFTDCDLAARDSGYF